MSTYYNPTKPNQDFSDCPPLLAEFLNYTQAIRGRAPRTVNAYYIDLRTFLRFTVSYRKLVAPETPPDEIDIRRIDAEYLRAVTKTEIYEFLYYVTQQRANNSTTRARKLSSIKGFFRYLYNKAGVLDSNPAEDIDSPAIKKRLPKYLSLEESIALLQSVESDFYARDYCIITLFLNCGMRLSELAGINITDIKDDTLRIIGKGNKERTVYLNEACLLAIRNLMQERAEIPGIQHEKALFVSKTRKTRLSPRRIQQIVGDCLAAAGLADKGYSVHKLRHTAATLLYQYGQVDMLVLKEILGHENVGTTQIYTHLNQAQLRKAASSSPLSGQEPEEPALHANDIDEEPPEN